MNGDVELKIDQSIIKPILEEKIRLALVQALGSTEELMDDMINTYLNQKCDKDGKIHRDSYYDKFRRIDLLLTKLIEQAVKQAILDWMATNQEKLAERVAVYFKTKSGTNSLIKAVNEALTKSIQSTWGFKMNVILPND